MGHERNADVLKLDMLLANMEVGTQVP